MVCWYLATILRVKVVTVGGCLAISVLYHPMSVLCTVSLPKTRLEIKRFRGNYDACFSQVEYLNIMCPFSETLKRSFHLRRGHHPCFIKDLPVRRGQRSGNSLQNNSICHNHHLLQGRAMNHFNLNDQFSNHCLHILPL